MTIVCLILFIILNIWLFNTLYSEQVVIKLPEKGTYALLCSGPEALIILMFATAWIGLGPFLAMRLALLEVLCVLGILKCQNSQPFSWAFILYIVFLAWVIYGITYTPQPMFGIRMLLKYLYPLLFALLTAKIVRDGEVMIATGLWSRSIAVSGALLIILTKFGVPFISGFTLNVLWSLAGYVTGLIGVTMFSLTLSEFTQNKKQNLYWTLASGIVCLLMVFRTDIFGTAIALAAFFLIKYKLKALPIILLIGILGICSIFYIPAVKEKMFVDPDKANMTEFIQNGGINDDNINTNYRKFAWETVQEAVYNDHPLKGAGTGRVQTYYQTEAENILRGGQLHNDLLVIQLDNGIIGLVLFFIAYGAIFLHCLYIYNRSQNSYTRIAAITAGASILGILATCYSDNTVTYSMVTFSFPWGFYGMTLGLKAKENETQVDIEYEEIEVAEDEIESEGLASEK